LLTLLGVAVVVLGFAARFNPLLVVVVAAMVTGLAAGLPPLKVLAALGKGFNDNRLVTVALLVYPVVGVAERAGLQERARMGFRQITAALGLVSIAGQAPTIRPLVAPMAEGAVEARTGELSQETREQIRAQAAATDNIGLFFGEDIFLAIGSILLMVGVLAQEGIMLDPLQLSVWAIPSAVAAFVIHGARLVLFERRLRRAAEPGA
jgi:uncharacterized membrane protein